MNTAPFIHKNKGIGRPQILLIGNGLERKQDPNGKGQPEWSEFLDKLRAPGRAAITEEEKKKVPFPLLYQLLSTPNPAPPVLSAEDIRQEEKRLADGLGVLSHESNALLDRLPTLGADHILTTNYPYSLEAAFCPKLDFTKPRIRSAARFSLAPPDKNKKIHRERCYRLHTGYEVRNSDGSRVGLWHIHGETSVPTGIVVGHDRYGRLLSRMEKLCAKELSHSKEETAREYRSWPELFLFGDVYVLGFEFALCEYDLWWLLRRKQRERYADGHVYYFTNHDITESSVLFRLLASHGVLLNPFGVQKQVDYPAFYSMAMDTIAEQIRINKGSIVQHNRKAANKAQGGLV